MKKVTKSGNRSQRVKTGHREMKKGHKEWKQIIESENRSQRVKTGHRK